MSTDRPATGDDSVRPPERAGGESTEPARPGPEASEPPPPGGGAGQSPQPGAWAPTQTTWPPPTSVQSFQQVGNAQPFHGQYPPPPPQPAVGQYWPPPGQPGTPASSGWGHYPPPPNHWSTTPPPPLSGQAPSTVPAAAVPSWLVALVVVTGVTLVALIATVAVPWLTVTAPPSRSGSGPVVPAPATAPTASTTPTETPSPSPTPTTPTPTMPTDPDEVLKQNPIYALKVTAKCPQQRIPSSQSAYREQVRALVDCQNKAWKKALAKTPVKFSKPKVKFYATSTKSPCGKLGTQFPASYCSANHTLYFSRAAYEQGRYFRLSVAHFVIHEYAHHVQELADILGPATLTIKNSSELSRRIELQAHCMAHYGLTNSGLNFSAADRRDAEYQFAYTNDPKGHGSTKAERYWGERGLDAKNIGTCNTWKAKASRVK